MIFKKYEKCEESQFCKCYMCRRLNSIDAYIIRHENKLESMFNERIAKINALFEKHRTEVIELRAENQYLRSKLSKLLEGMEIADIDRAETIGAKNEIIKDLNRRVGLLQEELNNSWK